LSLATQTLDELSALAAGNRYPATTTVVHQLRQLAVKGYRFDAPTRIGVALLADKTADRRPTGVMIP